MNKRIQELADEATEFCDIRDLTTGEYVDKPFVEKFAEKFAELIVKECAGLCEREGHNPFNNVWEKTRAKCDALMIREHFGVEE